MNIREKLNKSLLLLDGAMGTQIQERTLPDEVWQEKQGCNELLNLTAPDVIREIHTAYFQAGSDVVETNTFGASPLTLGEYDISEKSFEINRAAACLAREAANACETPDKPRFVLGSIGPGTRLPTLEQVSFDELCDGYQIQIQGLAEGGADGIIIETCQDLLQIKAALVAFGKVLGPKPEQLLYVSVTVEQTGTLLIGSDIGAVVAALSPYPIDVLGLNCATGPEAMRIHLDYLAENWPRYLACMPNAGLPEMINGEVHYPLGPANFTEKLAGLVREVGLNIIGGCCGTTPEHLKLLNAELEGFCPPERQVEAVEQATSIFSAVELSQEPPPLYIGERANATGSRRFRDTLLADDYEKAFDILVSQEEQGAHLLDLSCAYAGRDEVRDAATLAARAARECRLPLMVDSTQPDVVETVLKLYGGRMLINSINFESGEEKANVVTDLAVRFGAGLICLTIDEEGMAMNADRKVAVAKRLVKFCEDRGMRRQDLMIDPLTFTICSGDENLRTAAIETCDALRRIHEELPGVRTMLGLSNISFGLIPPARKILNAVFLDRCLKAGLDACIVNVATLAPLNQIPAPALKLAGCLLDNDQSAGDPLTEYINYFEENTQEDEQEAAEELPPEEALQKAVIKGNKTILNDLLATLLEDNSATDILNEMLIPAMKEVGRLFNDGIMQLPFVLKSAEVMKRAVDIIKPYMPKDEAASERATIVLATVAGDVHDIGKNLVNIILSNNGFKVIDLGTKVPVGQMTAAIREHNADVLGMSGLLVKSVAVMTENLKTMQDEGFEVPVLLGGAALTPGYVADTCQPEYSPAVIYCKDAFAGLACMREFSDTGTLPKTEPKPKKTATPSRQAAEYPIDFDEPAPAIPFTGYRIVKDIDLKDVYPYLNERALIRGRWNYRSKKMSAEDYEKLMNEQVYPQLQKLKEDNLTGDLIKPQVAYGYFNCCSKGDKLLIDLTNGETVTMEFPRQKEVPNLCLADFFRPTKDIVGFMVVTLGNGIEKANPEMLADDNFMDYFLLHGFATELTEALAEYWHKIMREEWGFDESGVTLQDCIKQEYRGARYGFGYPACPDLSHNKVCCDLVHAEEIGVGVSENFMMVPEVTTSALVSHHPRAKYFNT